MDRLEQLEATRRLAERVIGERGADGEARAIFLEEAVGFSHVSSAERVKIWNEAVGVGNFKAAPIP